MSSSESARGSVVRARWNASKEKGEVGLELRTTGRKCLRSTSEIPRVLFSEAARPKKGLEGRKKRSDQAAKRSGAYICVTGQEVMTGLEDKERDTDGGC